MTDTFNGTTLEKPNRTGLVYTPNAHISITCKDVDQSFIDTMAAFYQPVTEYVTEAGAVNIQSGGTKGDLVFAGVTWTNCYISSFKVNVIGETQVAGILELELVFAQHTAG